MFCIRHKMANFPTIYVYFSRFMIMFLLLDFSRANSRSFSYAVKDDDSGNICGSKMNSELCVRNSSCYHLQTGEDGYMCACNYFYAGSPNCNLRTLSCDSCKNVVVCHVGHQALVCVCKVREFMYICLRRLLANVDWSPCNRGKVNCTKRQECITEAESPKTYCVCKDSYYGEGCSETTATATPKSTDVCVDMGDNRMPLCLCTSSGPKRDAPGFCKPDLKSLYTFQEPVTLRPIIYAPTTTEVEEIVIGTTEVPDMEPKGPCVSSPCKHNAICKPHPSRPGVDFTCTCPLGFKGKVCDEIMLECNKNMHCVSISDCVSTPSGAICICDTLDFGHLCQITMNHVTDWGSIMLIFTQPDIHKAELTVAGILAFIMLLLLCLICHCCRVITKRYYYRKKYEDDSKLNVPKCLPPDWLEVSNDLCCQIMCCRTSKLEEETALKIKTKKKGKYAERSIKKTSPVGTFKQKDQNTTNFKRQRVENSIDMQYQQWQAALEESKECEQKHNKTQTYRNEQTNQNSYSSDNREIVDMLNLGRSENKHKSNIIHGSSVDMKEYTNQNRSADGRPISQNYVADLYDIRRGKLNMHEHGVRPRTMASWNSPLNKHSMSQPNTQQRSSDLHKFSSDVFSNENVGNKMVDTVHDSHISTRVGFNRGSNNICLPQNVKSRHLDNTRIPPKDAQRGASSGGNLVYGRYSASIVNIPRSLVKLPTKPR